MADRAKMTITHTIRHAAEGSFVLEQISGQRGSVEYGPMPADAVGPLIDERREWFEDSIKAAPRSLEAKEGER